VATGEGRFDEQSLRGKAVGAVLERAERARVPAIVLCGEAGVRPRGVVVRSLAEAVGTTGAMEQPQRALEDAAAGVAAQAEQLSSGA
jgi:glycerate kinase